MALKSKDLPPIIKSFSWRLICRALATAERATRYSTRIDNHCSDCGAVEDDAHLFFHCNLPRAIWFSFSPSIRTDTLPQENDGVQLILQSLISNSIPDALFHKILFTLWYIWKVRNDRHFRGYTWTPGQVNNVVAGHIKSNAQAKLLQATPSASTHTDADTMLQYHTCLSQGTLHYLAGPSTAGHQSQQIAANTTSSPTHLGLQGMVPAT
jgi:hypothetical protein